MGRKKNSLKLGDVPRYESVIEAIKKALGDVRKGRYKLRDLALVAILAFTGCRIGEALKLGVKDVDIKSKTIRITQEKKREEFYRIVPIPSKLFWEIIKRYLRRFPSKEMQLFKITDRQARNIVYKFTRRYLRKKIRPHALRHSYAIFVLKNTKDLETLRRLLGHSDYKWLKNYLDYTQEDLEEELERAFESIEEY